MRRILSVFLVLLTLAACTQADLVAKFVPKQEDQDARAIIQLLQQRQIDMVESRLDPGVKSDAIHASLEKLATLFPDTPPISIKTIGARTFTTGQTRETNLTYEVEYKTTWLLVAIATRSTAGNSPAILGINAAPQTEAIETRNRFSLAGKSALHYVFLVFAIVSLLFTLITLVACIRTRPIKRKWLWIVGILFGFGNVSLNWTTGHVFFNLLQLQLLSVGAVAAPFSPWIITVSLPVVAVLFWVKRGALIKSGEASKGQKSGTPATG